MKDRTTYGEQAAERARYGSRGKKYGNTNAILRALVPAVQRDQD